MKTLQAATLIQNQSRDVEIRGVRNIANIVDELWERSADRLTTAELEWFAGAGETAVQTMQNLEDVIDGIGCFVAHDSPSDGRAPCGHLQSPQDMSALMFFLSESVRHARSLVTVSESANRRLKNPSLYHRS